MASSDDAAYIRQLEARRLLRDLQAALDDLALELHRRASRSSLQDGFGAAEAGAFVDLIVALGRSVAGVAPMPAPLGLHTASSARDESAASELEGLRGQLASVVSERDGLKAELARLSTRVRVRDARPSDAQRARAEQAEAQVVRLGDRVVDLESKLAAYDRLGAPTVLADVVRRHDVCRRLGNPTELEAFVESAQAETAMLRAVVRELTIEVGWYESLLGPMILSLSRQETLVASLIRSAHPPPLPSDTVVQPLALPTMPRVLSAIVGVIPDDVVRSSPSVELALEQVEKASADGGTTSADAPAVDDATQRLLNRVRDGLRGRPELNDIHALRRHLDSVCRVPSLVEMRDREQRRGLISAARAAAGSRGSAIAGAVLRPDFQYSIANESGRAQGSTDATASTGGCVPSAFERKRQASPPASPHRSKVRRSVSQTASDHESTLGICGPGTVEPVTGPTGDP
ncbi:hypothetical protein P43SY_010864 [Pythium insidiosum]|uniref:Uncharacterized protein n=1 Tax=Pythium insidiosum TaxID=114742 RepID=A0AAD5L7I0_PYTIN|nr:hypothetical protein P43SY_010864 [Pythium insidiosum]